MNVTNVKIVKKYITCLQVVQSHVTNEKTKLALNLSYKYIKSRKSYDDLQNR